MITITASAQMPEGVAAMFIGPSSADITNLPETAKHAWWQLTRLLPTPFADAITITVTDDNGNAPATYNTENARADSGWDGSEWYFDRLLHEGNPGNAPWNP